MNTVSQEAEFIHKLESRHDREFFLRKYLDEVFKIVKDINTTSLNADDRFKRIVELESKYDIPKTHLV